MSHGTSTNSKILSDLGKCLLEAARFGNTEEVRNLMSNGAPLITDWLGTTPLHLAAIYGHSSTAEILIKSGISRDCRTKVDKVPLHFACQHGHFEIAKILVKGGAHVNAADMLMMTPLHWAVEANNFDICLLLLKSGVKTILKNKFNKTPLSIAQDKGYGPIEKLLIDDKFKALQDIDVAHHNAFLERSINSVKICRPEDIGSNNSLWKKPKTRRFPMVAGTWTGGEAQNQERLEISERKKLGIYKRRSYHRDDLVTPFLCGLHVSTPCSTNKTVKQENNLSALVSPSSVGAGTTVSQNGVITGDGSPLQKLKETVRQSTCSENSTLVASTSPLVQVTNTATSNVDVPTTVTASRVISPPQIIPKNIRVPKMTTGLESAKQRHFLPNIPVVSSFVLNSLPPDIKAIPLNMTVDELYKQEAMFQRPTSLLCLPSSATTSVVTHNPVSLCQTIKDSVLTSPKKRHTASVESHSVNPKKVQTEVSKTRHTSCISSTKVTKVTVPQVSSQPTLPVITSVTKTANKGGVHPTVPVNIPVGILKEILGGIVTLHSVPVKSTDSGGAMQTLAGITTEMGTIPLIPVSGEGGLQLIPLENSSPTQILSTTKNLGTVAGTKSHNKSSITKINSVHGNPTYFQHVVPAQHFMQASPSPFFVQPHVLPYSYPLATPNLSLLPGGYDIANAILGNRHSIPNVSENGTIPTLPVHAGAPSHMLMPTGIYLQPGDPSFYQLGGPPTLLHPPTFPQFVGGHSQHAFARAQIHPTFLQQHAPPVLVQSAGQPTILQSHMPRYVYIDPGGTVVSQVTASPSKKVHEQQK